MPWPRPKREREREMAIVQKGLLRKRRALKILKIGEEKERPDKCQMKMWLSVNHTLLFPLERAF